MSGWSVGAVGVAAKAFEGAVMHRIHNEIPDSVIAKAALGIFLGQNKELTSPHPLVGEINHMFQVAEHLAHDFGAALTGASHMHSGPKQGR